jgi:NDP-sugar pyrophosphorylase family protein
MKGMILAAGLGSRLRPLTWIRAKPAVPLLNRPLIRYAFDLLDSLRIREVVVNLHHLRGSVTRALEGVTPTVRFSPEREILGTAGAVGRVRDFWGPEPFVVCNGKIYFEQDLGPVLAAHQESRALATLVLVPRKPEDPFRPVFLAGDGRIRAFGHDLPGRPSGPGYVFTGVQILSPAVLDLIPEGPSDLVKHLYEPLVAQRGPVMGFVSRAHWFECSTPERYLEKSMGLLVRRGLNALPGRSGGKDCRKVVLGRGVRVPEGTSLERCVVWNGARLGSRCRLRDSIVAGEVEIPAGTRLSHVVVTPPFPETLRPTGEAHPGYWTWPLEGRRREKENTR